MTDEQSRRPHHHSDSEHVSQASYDQRYRSQERVWSGQPNPQLVQEVAGLSPGTALDAGCGEGADAIWLAEKGWNVTAVDFSSVAVERGAAAAAARGAAVSGRISWVHQDLTRWTPPSAAYDLVSVQFLQLPAAQREAVYASLARAVTPGGMLLVVGHSFSDLESHVQRPAMAGVYFTAEDVAGAILVPAEWDVLAHGNRSRQARTPDGGAATVHDTVLVARRRR